MMTEKRQIEYLPLEELKPYPQNPRTHSPAQVARIAASLQEFDWTTPILVDGENSIIAGHGRLLAAQHVGLAEVPVIRLSSLTPAQVRAYRIADNKLALDADWDEALLAEEFTALLAEDFDLELTGFGEEELKALLASGEGGIEGDLDDAPEPPEEPVSRLGDLWVMGKHRLLCGDSTKEGDVASLFGEGKPHLMVTDPPYGVDYDPDWRNRALTKGNRSIGLVQNDSDCDWGKAWALFPGEVAYVWHAGIFADKVKHSLEQNVFEVRCQVIWAKSHFAIGRGHYHVQHEPCWYAVRKGGTGHWQGDRTQTTLWEIDKPQKSETGHSTQKPIECMRRPIINNSKRGDGVYDPFVGSGTTLIAAEAERRVCFAMELFPAYVDVCVRRWEKVTGREAVLEGEGKTFAEVGVERERMSDGREE